MTETSKPLPEEAVTDAMKVVEQWRDSQGLDTITYRYVSATIEQFRRAMRAATQPTEATALIELGRLYNYADDDSRQFTRWQMVVAINHGYRLATQPTALSSGECLCDVVPCLCGKPTALPEEEVMRRARFHVERQTLMVGQRWQIWDGEKRFARFRNIADEGDAAAICAELNALSTPIPLKPKVDEDAERNRQAFALNHALIVVGQSKSWEWDINDIAKMLDEMRDYAAQPEQQP